MVKITKEIYEQIKNDLPEIEEQMFSRNGSQKLWDRLSSKYSVLLPGIKAHISQSGKITAGGMEFDYRPELEQLKEVILAYMIVHPVEGQLNDEINNQGKEVLNQSEISSSDKLINEKIEESKLYIRSNMSNKKQMAVEQIWDAFERLKTLYGENKKTSADKLIKTVSNNSRTIKELLEKEFKDLTKIGNEFHIRHFENDRVPLESDEFREYLYFRMLTLISYCLNSLENS